MQVKIGIKFHRDEINNLFPDEEIMRLREADLASRLYAKVFTFDKSSGIK